MHAIRYAALLVCAVLAACATPPPAPPPPPEPVPAAPPPVPEPAPEPPPPLPPPPRPVTIAAVGDIMLGTDFPDDRLPPQDGAGVLAGVTDVLSQVDVAFGNLEGTLLDGGEPFKVCKNPALCYLFRTPERYGAHLAAAGFDVLSLANNHARDFGEEGRTRTMEVLDALGIVHSGREGTVASWSVDTTRLAMIAFAPNPGSWPLLDTELAVAQVAALAADHHIVIVSFHGGAEGLDALNLPFARETYYGEDRGDVVAFSRAVIDAGADLVIGHGPHVPRAIELYKDRLVAYSLGNFATWQGISIAGIKGLAPIVTATLDGDGRFLDGRIVSARQSRPAGTRVDPSGEAGTLRRRLTAEDFGTDSVLVTADGRIVATRPAVSPEPVSRLKPLPQ